MHYGNCRALGYNKVSCQSAPASNGRQQRARDRELSVDSSPKASEVLDSDSSNESDGSNESDQRFRREMDQLDEIIMAGAHEIAENGRRLQEQA